MISAINSNNSQKTNQNPNFKGVYSIQCEKAGSCLTQQAIDTFCETAQAIKDGGNKIRTQLTTTGASFIACENSVDSKVQAFVARLESCGCKVEYKNVDIFSDSAYAGMNLEGAPDNKVISIVRGLFSSKK